MSGQELPPPPEAVSAEDGSELVRIWIGDGASHFTIDYGAFGGEPKDELTFWGALMADYAGQVVRAAMLENPDLKPKQAFKYLEESFRKQLSIKPNMSGEFTSKTFQ